MDLCKFQHFSSPTADGGVSIRYNAWPPGRTHHDPSDAQELTDGQTFDQLASALGAAYQAAAAQREVQPYRQRHEDHLALSVTVHLGNP